MKFIPNTKNKMSRFSLTEKGFPFSIELSDCKAQGQAMTRNSLPLCPNQLPFAIPRKCFHFIALSIAFLNQKRYFSVVGRRIFLS